MNLREYMRATSRRYCAAGIHAGGPGSGCRGPNCGRPPIWGRQPTMEEAKELEKYFKEKAFKKERKRLGLRMVTTKNPTGLTPQALAKLQQKPGGKVTVKEKQELKKKGALIDLKKQGLVLKTDVSRVVEKYVDKVKVGKRSYKVEVEVVKPVGAQPAVPMGKTKGRNVPEGPPSKAHSLHGQFAGAIKIDVKGEHRRTFVYDAQRDASGRGATVFVHKETIGNKSRVVIQEVKRAEHGHIEETRQYTFKSGKAGKEFLQQRYGIKKVRWTG